MPDNNQPPVNERLATLEANHRNMTVTMESNKEDLQELIKKLVTREEFTPVKLITYGLVATALTAVMVALLGHTIIH